MDRTAEFKSCVASIRTRSIPEHKQRLLNGHATTGSGGKKGGPSAAARTEFARMAAAIGRDIQATTVKLGKLAQLAKRKTLFDDRPVEISELTYIIKQDIAQLNQQIAQLQSFVKANAIGAGAGSKSGPGGKQVEEHNANVVMMLQSKLADTSLGFKDVLEIRTQNMKASRDRTEQFQFANPSAPSGPSSDSPLYASTRPSRVGTPVGAVGREDKGGMLAGGPGAAGGKGKGRAWETGNQGSGDFLALDMGGAPDGATGGKGGDGYMQMQVMENNSQDTYLSQRSTAIESIESTITELGSIFSQLATMVAQQGETVQRIDADTSDIANNVGGAQRELLRYYASMSSNRWLMLKVFGVIIVFFLLLVLVT